MGEKEGDGGYWATERGKDDDENILSFTQTMVTDRKEEEDEEERREKREYVEGKG